MEIGREKRKKAVLEMDEELHMLVSEHTPLVFPLCCCLLYLGVRGWLHVSVIPRIPCVLMICVDGVLLSLRRETRGGGHMHKINQQKHAGEKEDRGLKITSELVNITFHLTHLIRDSST